MKIEQCSGYELIEEKYVEELQSNTYLCRHKKTGARVLLVENDDENKVFYISFRTPSNDSTGVAHIIEHSVLCGSERFPVKDPFNQLEKSSLNTYLNASTYPDKTIYPVASCNEKDFQNLMHVYLDAVFYPNIYHEKRIFMQEGWHYECETPDDDITINGVVYNEMKGVFSSPDDIFYRECMDQLYPDNAYCYESGGDPNEIPKLSYEEFLAFHKKYYHPSNAYIYLYGNTNMEEKLQFIEKEYLSKFEKKTVDSLIPLQKPFAKPRDVRKTYSIGTNESPENNTYLSYSVSVETSLDEKLYVAFSVLDYVLCSAQGAPVREALIKKGIGTEVFSYYENGIRQPFFSFVAKNANDCDKEQFVTIIEETLQKLVENGIDKKALLAGVNCLEFRFREADFGNYPKGLIYGLQILDSWLYDDKKPLIHIQANETFRFLKEQIETDYYEQLIDKYILKNMHKSIFVLSPEKGKSAKEEQELLSSLQKMKNGMTKEQLQKIIGETKELKRFQEEEDTKEALATIPTLSLSDVKIETEPVVNEEKKIGDYLCLWHNIFTNQIAYLRLVFDLYDLPKHFYPYLGLFKEILGSVDTQKYEYGELEHEEHILTGGISFSICSYSDSKKMGQYKTTFEVKVKTLYENIQKTFEFVEEMMFHSKYDSMERIREILEETFSRMESDLVGNGHVTAVNRAESYHSASAAVGETLYGISAYHFLADLLEHYEERADELQKIFEELILHLFRKENFFFDVIADETGMEKAAESLPLLTESLFDCPVQKEHFEPLLEKKNEGFTCASKVQYVCHAGNFVNKGIPYKGSMKVMKSILSRDYFWNHVRVKNGAYGCFCAIRKNGDGFFVSYRDPKLKETVEVFQAAADYLENLTLSEEEVSQYIIGTIADMDVPLTPSMKGIRAYTVYMTNSSFEELQKERDEVMGTTLKDLQESAKAVRAIMDDACFTVVGNEQKLEESKEMFGHIEPLMIGE